LNIKYKGTEVGEYFAAGVPRVVFLSKPADYGVDTFRLTDEELNKEASFA